MLWSRTAPLLETAEILWKKRRNESPEEEIIDAEIAAAEEQVSASQKSGGVAGSSGEVQKRDRRTVRGTGKKYLIGKEKSKRG